MMEVLTVSVATQKMSAQRCSISPLKHCVQLYRI